MERQNSNPTRMDLDSATGVSTRRTRVHLPPARQLLMLRGSRGQEIPRNPASRQTGQPGDRAAGGARREGRGTPWAAGACCREALAEREPEPEQGPPEREPSKSWLSTGYSNYLLSRLQERQSQQLQTKERGP